MLDEQTHVLLKVTRTLERLEVPYFVAGSFASNVHGFYRATADADLVADMKLRHLEPFVEEHWAGELRLTDLLQRALEESGLA